MLNLLRKLLGRSEPAAEAPPEPSPFERLNIVAPLRENANGTPEAAKDSSFIRRDPVLNRSERIAGYEFCLQEKMQSRLQEKRELIHKIYDEALLSCLTSIRVNSLLGDRVALVRLSPVSLGNPLIERMPVSNTVLMVTPTQQAFELEQTRRHLERLKRHGFAHGWLLRKAQLDANPLLLDFAAQADYIQVETSGFDGMDIKFIVKSLRLARPAGLPQAKLIASKLGAFDEFNLCFQSGFDLFLGPFVISRENWRPPKSDINRMHVIQLLNSVRSEAEIGTIAQQIKHEPTLSFKLLRYINSPVMGLQSAITTMDKALIVLGREKFYRWLSLLLFDIKTPGYRDRVLTEQALARAYLLERLAGRGRLPDKKDLLFLLGLFSLLDLLMGQSMPDILQQARLPDPIHEALLGQEGIYLDALHLAAAAENVDHEALERQTTACGLNAEEVSHCIVEALGWASEIAALNED